MSDGIKIPITGDFDASQVERQVNDFGRKIAEANKVQYKPVSVRSLDDLDKITKKFEEIRRINGELNRRMNVTSQQGKSFTGVDYDRIYDDHNVRARKTKQIFEYVVGNQFGESTEKPNSSGGRGPSSPTPKERDRPAAGKQQTAGGMIAGAAQAGLRAAGPVGGVAANAMGTGIASGAGAGLMGLMGGILALGVGKLVGAVMDKVGTAQDNAVAMDKLKRAIGDVNVSFNALRGVVEGAGDAMKISYTEAGQLAAQFVKEGNTKSSEFKSLGDEIGVGVGVSRSFGLDPSAGVGVMGQMRGMKVTTDTQESRRFALLIGETIGKSDAFAKADEVIGAIGGYAMSQTRANKGDANVGGYAGAFSSLVGSGTPGLDPTGAANLLSKVGAAITAGGAAGEPSQFFTASLGARRGLDPFETQMLREQGAFGTTKGTFGKGSIADKFGMGRDSGLDQKTNLQDQLEGLRAQYPGDDKMSRGMLAHATGRQLNTTMNEAALLHMYPANKMGELEQFGDLSKFRAGGIGNLVKSQFGSADDRTAVANSLNARKDIPQADKDAMNKAMSSGDEAAQKQILGTLTAQYDQERTLGSDIRDSKATLENILLSMANRLVPLVDQVRQGVMFLAGGKDKLSSNTIRKEIEDRESGDRQTQIKSEYAGRRADAFGERDDLSRRRGRAREELDKTRGSMTIDQIKAAEIAIAGIGEEIAKADLAARQKRVELTTKENALIAEEIESRDKKKREIDGVRAPDAPGGAPSVATSVSPRLGARPVGSSQSLVGTDTGEHSANMETMFRIIAKSEGAGPNTLVGKGAFNNDLTDLSKHPNKVGMVTKDGPSTAAGFAQINKPTYDDVAPKLGITSFDLPAQKKITAELIRMAGAKEDVEAGRYEEAAKKLGGRWQSLPSGKSKNQPKHTWEEFNRIVKAAEAEGAAVLSAPGAAAVDAASKGKSFASPGTSTAPADVRHNNAAPVPEYSNEGRNRGAPVGSANVAITLHKEDGTEAAPPKTVAVNFPRSSPFGMSNQAYA